MIADSKEKLQDLLDVVVKGSKKMGLDLNEKKTEIMVITRKKTTIECCIKVNSEKLKQVKKIRYLGAIISEDGKCEEDIKNRMTLAKAAFIDMRPILTNRDMDMTTKLKIM